ncbi:MAG: SpoIID/LytB domain-containing protein [Elusimicrobia bacterium]|nr:SpoIID/LytB domain-containing protein [Elusimicrobiota bacterium]
MISSLSPRRRAALLAAGLIAAGCARRARQAATVPASRPPEASGASPAPARLTKSLIQIGIVTRGEHLTLHPNGTYTLTDQKTGQSQSIESGKGFVVQPGDRSRYLFGPFELQGPARLSPKRADGTMTVGQKRYRGTLLVRPNGDATFAVINELGMEEYLYGVIPAEMSSDWPLEALKAQAVVARTFALQNMGKFQSDGFDLTSDSRSQVYAGVDKETPRIVQAVDATRGQVLTWRGETLHAFFHSCCGGHTGDYGSVWGGGHAPKPLRGVSDKYCRASPQYQWSAYFSDDDILAALQRHGHAIAKLKNVRIREKDSAGFVSTFRVAADDVSFDVNAKDFRNWLGNTDLKSTKVLQIARKKKGYTFLGRGFGHGVGLCQWGAHFMAKQDKDYRKILVHYFPQAELSPYHD